jgi:hypothetical protein
MFQTLDATTIEILPENGVTSVSDSIKGNGPSIDDVSDCTAVTGRMIVF